MKIYITSKNTGPSWSSDSVHMKYIGTSLEDAVAAVGNFVKYEDEDTTITMRYLFIYTVLPEGTDFVFERFYMADGWWYSVVSLELSDQVV